MALPGTFMPVLAHPINMSSLLVATNDSPLLRYAMHLGSRRRIVPVGSVGFGQGYLLTLSSSYAFTMWPPLYYNLLLFTGVRLWAIYALRLGTAYSSASTTSFTCSLALYVPASACYNASRPGALPLASRIATSELGTSPFIAPTIPHEAAMDRLRCKSISNRERLLNGKQPAFNTVSQHGSGICV